MTDDAIRLTSKDGSTRVPLKNLSVEISIHGFLSQTTTTLTFHNPTGSDLEGELAFPLDEGNDYDDGDDADDNHRHSS